MCIRSVKEAKQKLSHSSLKLSRGRFLLYSLIVRASCSFEERSARHVLREGAALDSSLPGPAETTTYIARPLPKSFTDSVFPVPAGPQLWHRLAGQQTGMTRKEWSERGCDDRRCVCMCKHVLQICVCVYVYTYIYTQIYTYIYIYIYTHIHTIISVDIYMCIYIYIMCIYIYIYVYIYIYIYRERERERESNDTCTYGMHKSRLHNTCVVCICMFNAVAAR